MKLKRLIWWFFIIFSLWIGFLIILTITFQPSHDRIWELGHEALPFITIVDDTITITNYRHFEWTGEYEAVPHYETRQLQLSEIQSVSVLISHFSDFTGLAHIFLSFELATGTPVVVSLETRREADEEFSPLLGVLRQYEIIYVVGDERDLIGVRTEYRNERVYLYPTKATPTQAQALFVRLSQNINAIYQTPKMYNTLLRNCTNEITRVVETIAPVAFPLTWRTLFPGYFAEVLYDMNIIDTTQPFGDMHVEALIDNTVADPTQPDFSTRIRQSK